MEQVLFDDLVQSLKEAKAIVRGEAPASRRIKAATPDNKAGAENAVCAARINPASSPNPQHADGSTV